MPETPVSYTVSDAEFESILVAQGDQSRPTVMVHHGWEGMSDGLLAVARRIVPWGYNAVAVDIYGKGKSGTTPEECQALMQPFMEDRALLAARLKAAFGAVAALPSVDEQKIAAIGFCFGGLCVLDSARLNLPLCGVASFHGVFTPPPGPPPAQIHCKVAVYHGWDDPLAPPEDVVALAKEFSEAKADWHLIAYGHTMHAFMAEGLSDPENGIAYNERSATRAWAALGAFLKECFG